MLTCSVTAYAQRAAVSIHVLAHLRTSANLHVYAIGSEVTTKSNLNGPGDLCGGGWLEGAFTTCDGSTVVSVNSVAAGPAQCQKESIVVPVGHA